MGVAGYHDFQHSLRRVLTPPARTCCSLFPCFPPCSQVRPQTVPLRRVLSAEAPSALLRSGGRIQGRRQLPVPCLDVI